MATIGNGGSGRGKRVDQELPLVPFIDLLFCCVMFLLATAVWSNTAEMPALTQGSAPDQLAEPPETMPLVLRISQNAYTLESEVGTQVTLPLQGNTYDQDGLAEQLAIHARVADRPTPVHLHPDDDVDTGALIGAMDVLRGAGFEELRFPAT